ncbi:hypothetical protein CORC01_08088 [Colletotrichum orchidophilum]|uniref:BTB domain-containing protein n=1 Tax=Colletotrichum orchidophilum TaxID=1209926 RepID=A0A1G4B5E1_9PEZI|nr:uncharacterized protein CORC01_08088 [Colletotrichum orchidophilum]OHE96631.1 hypothetical protein CORC01_08088 [Colletotrichum orchidophilum]
MAEEDHRWMLVTGMCSDFKIICEDEEMLVHKAVLAMHSEYFRALFNNDFEENKNGFVDFQDIDPGLMLDLLDYFYKGTTEWDVPKVDTALHIRLWILANRLEARTVMLTIEKRMMAELKTFSGKIRVAHADILGLVFTNLACAKSALGYIIGEAAYVLLLDPKRAGSATEVNDACSRHHNLSNMMLFWSSRYAKFTDHDGLALLSAKVGNVRDDLIVEKFTK